MIRLIEDIRKDFMAVADERHADAREVFQGEVKLYGVKSVCRGNRKKYFPLLSLGEKKGVLHLRRTFCLRISQESFIAATGHIRCT
jgi:hypothetical protein